MTPKEIASHLDLVWDDLPPHLKEAIENFAKQRDGLAATIAAFSWPIAAVFQQLNVAFLDLLKEARDLGW